MIILCSYDLGNSKHDFFPKRNYDKRVDARIIRKGLKKKYGIFHTFQNPPIPLAWYGKKIKIT